MIMAINVEPDSRVINGRLITEKPLHEKTCLSLFEAWLHKVKIGFRRDKKINLSCCLFISQKNFWMHMLVFALLFPMYTMLSRVAGPPEQQDL